MLHRVPSFPQIPGLPKDNENVNKNLHFYGQEQEHVSAERAEEPTSGVGRAQLTIGQDGLVISSARKEHYPFRISKEGQRTLLRRPPRPVPSVAFP